MNTETIAQDIARDRAEYIEDMQDVEWYAHEVHGERDGDFDVDAVIARVAEILSVTR